MGLDITKTFKVTDEATAGKWFDLGGARFLIARTNNERHRSVMKRLSRPYRHMKTIPDGVVEELTIQGMAEAILIDWKDVEENGAPVECTIEKKVEYLTSYKDFQEQVAAISLDYRNFVDEDVDEKN